MSQLHGVFAVLKPKGITCAQLCNQIKEILFKDLPYEKQLWFQSAIRLGHGGTLDMNAYGVLAIGIGAGCKQLRQFLMGPKEYRCTAVLGTETDTYNQDGRITDRKPYGHVTRTDLETRLQSFVGTHFQTPPVYSALKYKGHRLSDLARAGKPLPVKQPRKVILYSAKCIHFKPPNYSLEIACGPGFYVRSLVHDLGRAVNTCSHIIDLERTKHGLFTKAEALDMSEVTMDNVKYAISKAEELYRKDSSMKNPLIYYHKNN